MTLTQALLKEFDYEVELTRKILQQLPGSKFSWKPHNRSWSAGELASHIAYVVSWLKPIIDFESYDPCPPGCPSARPPIAKDMDEVFARFDQNAKSARGVLTATDDEELGKMWSLSIEGNHQYSLRRSAAIRSFCLNHVIHHRGQFTVYLRLNNILVPSIYGPSADEPRLSALTVAER